MELRVDRDPAADDEQNCHRALDPWRCLVEASHEAVRGSLPFSKRRARTGSCEKSTAPSRGTKADGPPLPIGAAVPDDAP
jgi:hypothetical protein